MKKVALTGHTGTVGSAILRELQHYNFEVVGISRSSGYDLTDEMDYQRAIDDISTCDLFINNGYIRQQQLLEDIWDRWQGDSGKQIITIGALSTRIPSQMLINTEYTKIKSRLSSTVFRLYDRGHWPRQTLVHAGLGPDMTWDFWANQLICIIKNFPVLEITLQ